MLQQRLFSSPRKSQSAKKWDFSVSWEIKAEQNKQTILERRENFRGRADNHRLCFSSARLLCPSSPCAQGRSHLAPGACANEEPPSCSSLDPTPQTAACLYPPVNHLQFAAMWLVAAAHREGSSCISLLTVRLYFLIFRLNSQRPVYTHLFFCQQRSLA